MKHENPRVQLTEQESEARLTRAQEIAHLGSWELDLVENRLSWSDEAYRIFGLQPQEFAATYESFMDCVHPDDRAAVHAAYSGSVRENRDSYQIEHRLIRKGGDVRWVQEKCQHLRDETGRIVRSFGVVMDITNRKQAEQALVQSEARFRLLSTVAARLLAAEDPLALVKELCTEVMSHLDCHMFFNFVTDSASGRLRLNAYAGIPPEEARRIEWLDYGTAVCGCAARDGCRIVAEDIPNTPDPRTELVKSYGIQAYACHPLLAGGHIIGTLSFGTITRTQFSDSDLELMKTVADQVAVAMERLLYAQELEQRVQERTLQLEQQAERLRALASELTQTEERQRRHLAQILHDDLQQLLVGARMTLASLKHAKAEQLQPEITSVDALLDASLEVSRSLTSELSPPILYEGGLAPALEVLARQMHQKYKLVVHLDLDGTVQPAREAVRVLLFQAARELLFNAFKHSGVLEAHLALKRHGQLIKLIVSDNGKGFDAPPHEACTREPCFGLFSIRQRFQMFGGNLVVESAPGKGSRLTLTVPLLGMGSPTEDLLPRSPVKGPTFEPIQPGRKIRVLLADDHEVMRRGLGRLLAEQGDIQVVAEAPDGIAAVELARQLLPDVVVMDMSMPRLSGIEATRQIAMHVPQVRVIGLSMHRHSEAALAMRHAGAVEFVSKTAPADNVIAAIRRATRKADPEPNDSGLN